MERDTVCVVSKTVVEYTTTAELIRLDDNLSVYKIAEQPVLQEESGDGDFRRNARLLTKRIREGLVDDSQRELLLGGQNFESKSSLTWVPVDLIEVARTQGWEAFATQVYEQSKNKTAVWDNSEGAEQKRFSLFDLAATDPDKARNGLVRMEGSGHMLFDRHDQVLPVALHYDYIQSHIDESHHNLPKLAWHLLNRPDVRVFHANPEKYKKTPTWAVSVEDAIFHIPGYNAEKGRNKSVQFLWVPETTDYQKVWAEISKLPGNHPSTRLHRTVMEMDILGIKEAGCLIEKTPKKTKSP